MSFGGGPSLGGGLMVAGSGGGAGSPSSYIDPLAPLLECGNGGGPGDSGPGGSCSAPSDGNGGSGNPWDNGSGGNQWTAMQPMSLGSASSCSCSGGGSGGGGAFSGGGPAYTSDGSYKRLDYAKGAANGNPWFAWKESLGAPLGLGDTGCALPPPPGTAPEPVPGPTAPNIEGILVVGSCGMHSPAIGIWVTCAETGVTLSSQCTTIHFYHETLGQKNYTAAGGFAPECAGGSHNYDAHTTQGTGNMGTLIIGCNCT